MLHKPGLLNGVLRAKGCFWTAADPDTRLDLSLVGNTVSLIVSTTWVQAGIDLITKHAKVELYNADSDDANTAAVRRAVGRLSARAAGLKEQSMWHPVTEDRRVELVFIGDRDVMNEALLREEVEAALLTQAEMDVFMRNLTESQAAINDASSSSGSSDNNNQASADATVAKVSAANPFATVPRCLVL